MTAVEWAVVAVVYSITIGCGVASGVNAHRRQARYIAEVARLNADDELSKAGVDARIADLERAMGEPS